MYLIFASSAVWLSNADVYVGNCPSTSIADITSNSRCNEDIGPVAGTETVIEVKCTATVNYGRYVYIHKDTTSSAQIALCEVEVFGDDSKYSEQGYNLYSQGI